MIKQSLQVKLWGGGVLRDRVVYLGSMWLLEMFVCFVCLFCCSTSQVNSYGHGGTVSSPNHTFPGQA